MKKIRDNNTPLLVVLALFFSVGLVLGSVSYFHIPNDVLNGVKFSFQETTFDFSDNMKNNFITEFTWLGAVWLLNNMSLTAPVSGAVIALRGFLVGFCVTFIIGLKSEDMWGLLLSNILPQTLVAIPLLTCFTMLFIRISVNKKEQNGYDVSYFLAGAGGTVALIASSALETLLTMIFIHLL